MRSIQKSGATLVIAALLAASATPRTAIAQNTAATTAIMPVAQRGTGTNMGGGNCSANIYNCADTPNPLPPTNTVWLEEMTWMDVRDAIKAGKTTVIIATGGMEPNGPWLVTGKHNYVNRSNCEAIARRLGNALCAPLIKWVPEGRIEPPSSHMTSPGTISLREETFRAMLMDVAHSLKMHGFKNIIFIGDSGGNQTGQRLVADSLTKLWGGNPVIAHVQEYYTYSAVGNHMETRGITEGQSDGLHDDPIITLNMFHTDPASVRWAERVKANKATINGVSIADRVKSLELAREIVRFRAEFTAEAINRAIANKGTVVAAGRGGRAGGAANDSTAAAAAGGGGGGGGGGGRAGRAGAAGGGAAGAATGGRGNAAGAAANAGGAAGRGGRGAAGAGGAASGGGAAGAAAGGAAGATSGAGGRAGGAAQQRASMGGGNCSASEYNCADAPTPVPAPNTVWMEELTWMDVRDALKAGKTTAIVSTGGIEPNGPWLVLGKHNYVLKANCDAIARKLGNALCAPIIPLVPEGRIEPPSGHMLSPGTISLRQATFEALLTDVVHSLRMHGFTNIILIGDSGGNASGMQNVADTLTARFAGAAKVIHIPEYYTAPPGSRNVLREQGVVRDSMPDDGLHDGAAITLNMMLTDINSVRWHERVQTGQAYINGVSIADLGRSLELARMVSDARAERTAALIRERIAARR